jgi:hypothetical protein
VNEDWGSFGGAGQTNQALGASGVSESTVLINGGAQAHEQMEDEGGQISSVDQNGSSLQMN